MIILSVSHLGDTTISRSSLLRLYWAIGLAGFRANRRIADHAPDSVAFVLPGIRAAVLAVNRPSAPVTRLGLS